MKAARVAGQELSKDLAAIIRGIPRLAKGSDLVSALRKAVLVVDKARASGKVSTSTGGWDSGAQSARDEAIRIVNDPLGHGLAADSTGSVYGPGNKYREKAQSLITRMIAGASGGLGVGAVIAQATKEFVADLTNPKSYADQIKKYAILIGLALIAVNVLPGLVARVARGK